MSQDPHPDARGGDTGEVTRPTDPALPRGLRRPIAPLWHTAALLAIILSITAYGAYLQHHAGSKTELMPRRGSALPLYLSLIAAEWGLLRLAIVGLRKSGTRVRDVMGQRWVGWQDVARDVVLALLVWAAWNGAEVLAAHLFGPDAAKRIDTLLPRGAAEITAWIALSLSAGICEEVVFRGYFQQQFRALSGSAGIAVVAQGVVFGAAHGYQGLRNTLVIAILGVIYGALAEWRRNLRPGMLLHAWTDVFSGVLGTRG